MELKVDIILALVGICGLEALNYTEVTFYVKTFSQLALTGTSILFMYLNHSNNKKKNNKTEEK